MQNSKWVAENLNMDQKTRSDCFNELGRLNPEIVAYSEDNEAKFTGPNFQIEYGQILAKHCGGNVTIKVAEYQFRRLKHLNVFTFSKDGEIISKVNMDDLLPEYHVPIVIELGVQHPRITESNWFNVQTHIQSELYNGKSLKKIIEELKKEAADCEDDDFDPESMNIQQHMEVVNQAYPNTYCLTVETPESNFK